MRHCRIVRSHAPRSHSQGFTLLEIAIVLLIIALIIGGSMVTLTASVQTTQYNATVSQMDTLEKALLDYSVAYGRLPCPSSLTLLPTDVNYGVEAANKGSCTGGTPAATSIATVPSYTVEGGIPTRALRLPDSYQYDAWGHRLRYAVDPTFTVSASLPVNVGGLVNASGVFNVGGPCTPSASAITVNDSTTPTPNPRTTTALYAIISHGANGHGGYTQNGVMLNAGSTNTYEKANCNCSASAVATTPYTPIYYQQLATQNKNTASDAFDDIVTYKEPWQMQTPGKPLQSACQYLYVTDYDNHGIEKFDLKGNFVSVFGNTYPANGSGNGALYNPNAVALDSQGNLWVIDSGNSRIEEFAPNGAYLSKFANPAGMTAPDHILIDASNNLWLSDSSSASPKIFKVSTTGTVLSSFGTNVSSGSGATAAAGKFACDDWGICILMTWDNNGNLILMDVGNERIQRCTTLGSCVVICCNAGVTAATQFGTVVNGLESVPAVDKAGNIWVGDGGGNNRMMKIAPNGQSIFQFPCASGVCPTSATPGQINSPDGGVFDNNNNLWVVDAGNYRIDEFDSLGNYIMSFGSQGTGNGQFENAIDINIGVR